MKNKDNLNAHKSYLKSFGLSSLFGLFFGLVVLVIILLNGESQGKIVFTLPFYCGLISGLAGITGSFLLDWLKKQGIKSRLWRSIISFIAVLFMTLIITGIVISRFTDNFYSILQNRMIWGVLFGCIFGITVAAVEYYNWKMRALKMENKYLEELARKDNVLREATEDLLQAQERNTIARELHDSISQGIHGITFGIGSLRRQLENMNLNDEKVTEIVDHLDKTAENTLIELKHMIKELKPAILEKSSLKETLTAYCDLFAELQQIEVEKDLDEIKDLSPDQQLAIYRIVQEALGNVQKHAGADKVEINLKKTGNEVLLVVRDYGQGFIKSEIARGNGLNNMEVRSRQTGGKFDINSCLGKGTEVKVRFELSGGE